MQKKALFLSTIIIFANLKGADLPSALTYTPTISNQTKLIVGGTSLIAAAASFWLMHTCTENNQSSFHYRDKKRGAWYEAFALACSPLKALCSFLNIKNSLPSAQTKSFFILGISSFLAYFAGKCAFGFTPEGKFIDAQELIKDTIFSNSWQELTDNQNPLENKINLCYTNSNHPQVTARNFFKEAREHFFEALQKLKGISSIEDARAHSYIAQLKEISKEHNATARDYIQEIMQDPQWQYHWQTYLQARAWEEQMALQRKHMRLLARKTRAQEHTAYVGRKVHHYHHHH